eukprot:TRINITY_DN4928_c0_g1_i3.p1 TRINITY_DN4928_c0_g1~~TRINITY_DN4928_c0_g1_i3.p1  ORF type:complete len:383 (-),score=112.18 TRINITY_DN4928_c0_g1_i3:736-1830(-)
MELRSTTRRFRWYWSKTNDPSNPELQEYPEDICAALEKALASTTGTQKVRVDDERYVDVSSRDRPVQLRYDDKKKANERIVKREEQFDEEVVRWWWSADSSGKSDKWVEYAEPVAVQLEKGFKSKMASVRVDDDRYVDLSDLDNMLQRRNDDASKRRAVKREVTIKRKAVPVSRAAWSWFGDSKWEPYDKATSAKLEAAFQSNQARVDVDDQRYCDMTDRANITQARKDGKGKRRAVKRDELLDDEEQPLVKKTKTSASPASSPASSASHVAAGSGALRGLVFAQTGSHSMVRAKLEALIASHGGRTTDGVTGSTTHLIANATDSQTSKFIKAQQRGTPIVTEDFLHDCIKRNTQIDHGPYLIQ